MSSRKIGRGVLAALAAGAMTLTLGSAAYAEDVINPDNMTITPVAPGKADLYRIADADRISTAILASRNGKWGTAPVAQHVRNYWDCGAYTSAPRHGATTNLPAGTQGQFDYWLTPQQGGGIFGRWIQITCTVKEQTRPGTGSVDIIISRDDNFSDALAATTMADVTDAPILLNPTRALDQRVKGEIARLAGLTNGGTVRVHLLGGVEALSQAVHNEIKAMPGVTTVLRHQGIDRYETAVGIANFTIGHPQWFGNAEQTADVNTYLTTGLDFPDALSAGAAAANNNGVVLLTAGTQLDRRGFTDNFLIQLRNLVNESTHYTTTKNYAVGGPSAKAAADFDIRLAASYVGVDRYETATKTATATFNDPTWFAVASGENYPDALVAGGWIANADGPLLLTRHANLSPVTGQYLTNTVNAGDKVVVFGGGNSVSLNVQSQVAAAIRAAFPVW